jgi:hypothetical protein
MTDNKMITEKHGEGLMHMESSIDIEHLRQKLLLVEKHSAEAVKLQRQIDLLEDASKVYRLVSGPRK